MAGSARLARRRAARSNSERAAAKDCVGNRFGSQVVWNRSNRCAGARGGARVGRPRWGEDFDNHRRIFDRRLRRVKPEL